MRAVGKSAGWSQRTLANRIGVDAQAMTRLERDVGLVATLAAVVAALDLLARRASAGSDRVPG